MKCEICGKRIKVGLLGKIKGTYIKDENGKLHIICDECQRKFKTKKEVLKQLK